MERTVILYHDNCPDGFGGAYAAWKKFGDTAEYLPVQHQAETPAGLKGAHLYLIDFCYPKDIMNVLAAEAASLTVLDHHEGVEDVVEAMPAYVYDAKRSGATIAWSYFHPETPVPVFLDIVMKADLYQMLTDDERAIISYAYAQPYSFSGWDTLTERVENPESRAEIIGRGRAYAEYFQLLATQIASRARRVRFEGHEVYLISAPRMFATELGTQLRKKGGAFTLITRNDAHGSMRVSMRAGDNKTVNLAELAQKYGGNGHPGSAAFSLEWGAPIPWEVIEHDESSSD